LIITEEAEAEAEERKKEKTQRLKDGKEKHKPQTLLFTFVS